MSSCRRCIPAFSHTNMKMTEVLWALPCSQLHASYVHGNISIDKHLQLGYVSKRLIMELR